MAASFSKSAVLILPLALGGCWEAVGTQVGNTVAQMVVEGIANADWSASQPPVTANRRCRLLGECGNPQSFNDQLRGVSNEDLCKSATRNGQWETYPQYAHLVTEANARGLTCAREKAKQRQATIDQEEQRRAEAQHFEEQREQSTGALRTAQEKEWAKAARRAEEEKEHAEAARKALENQEREKEARRAEEKKKRAEAARRAEEDRKRGEAARRAEEERKKKALLKPVLIGAGSSFIISDQGHLLTNQHVVDVCQIVTVHPPSGLKKAHVVATDDTNDLALLKTDFEYANSLPISSKNASLLDDVVVAGYPLSDSLSSTVKVTKGVVSSLAGLGNDYSQIQIDAAIQPGNSGGPILNDQGNVVGVTVAALNKELFLKEQGTIPENTNFGIKSSTARAFVDANGVKLPPPHAKPMSRRDMADLITKTTHLVGCWVTRATAQKMASDQKQELSVTPTMQRQVEALR